MCPSHALVYKASSEHKDFFQAGHLLSSIFQERLQLPVSPSSANFNTAVSAAVAAAVARQSDMSPALTAISGSPPPSSTSAFFQATTFHNQQTPPSTPLSVTTAPVSSHEPLFTISDHFVNSTTTTGGSFTTVNGHVNTLTTINNSQRKLNENSLVVSLKKEKFACATDI